MSNAQRMLFAVCLVSAISVALVQCQGSSASNCARGAQTAVNSWSQGMRQTILSFARSTQSTATDLTNFEGLTNQVNDLSEHLMSYFHADTPFDISTINALTQRIVKFQFDLSQNLLQRNTGSLTGFSSSYFKAITGAMETNAGFMQSLTDSCIPGSRRPKSDY